MVNTVSSRPIRYFSICLMVYALGVCLYAAWNYQHARRETMGLIDERLSLAAKSLKYLLVSDFHDRATGPDAISFEEELANRKTVSGLAAETAFTYLYTVVEKDGAYYFSAPTVTPEEAKAQRRWYYHPYADIPDAFVRAFKENRPVFVSYADQWGHFRSIAYPETSPGGRRYLACADYDIAFVQSLLRENLTASILTAMFFFALTIPFVLVFMLYNSALQKKNAELAAHRDKLELRVAERTRALTAAKEKAEQLALDREAALQKVKKLSGLLPICANCKKIRDDKGYWSAIEQYISEHSEAEFTHSMCRECAKMFFPTFKYDDE